MIHIKAVAFDVDGTLYSERRLYLSSLDFALRHARFIHHFRNVRQELRRLPQNLKGYDNLYATQAALLAARLHLSAQRATEIIERYIYHIWMKRIARQPLYKGVRLLLRHLQQWGVPVAAMSDFPIERKFAQWDINEYFQHIIECEQFGMLKPSPRLFQQLAARIGLKPAHILYVGNSRKNDVEGAVAAGMPAAYLAAAGRHHPAAACNFSHYRQLATFIVAHVN